MLSALRNFIRIFCSITFIVATMYLANCNIFKARAQTSNTVEAILANSRERARLCVDNSQTKTKEVTWRIENTICFFGKIDDKSKLQFFALHPKQNDWLVVDSDGGRVDSALDIADVIFSKNINIIVWRFCISSCANYFFPAAYDKIVLENSFVAWHGGPSRTPPANISDSEKEILRELVIRNDEFFAKIGVDGKLIFTPPPNTKVTHDGNGVYSFWMNTKKDLELLYGIKHIIYMEDYNKSKN